MIPHNKDIEDCRSASIDAIWTHADASSRVVLSSKLDAGILEPVLARQLPPPQPQSSAQTPPPPVQLREHPPAKTLRHPFRLEAGRVRRREVEECLAVRPSPRPACRFDVELPACQRVAEGEMLRSARPVPRDLRKG